MATKITITRKTDRGYKGSVNHVYYINYGSYPETVKVYVETSTQRATFYSEGNVGMNNLHMFLKAQAIAIRIIQSWEARWTREAVAKWENATTYALRFSHGDSWIWDRATGELFMSGGSVIQATKKFSSVQSAYNYLTENVKGQGGLVIAPIR